MQTPSNILPQPPVPAGNKHVLGKTRKFIIKLCKELEAIAFLGCGGSNEGEMRDKTEEKLPS